MCYYISIGVPIKHSEWATDTLSNDFEICKTENPSVREQIGPEANAYTVTKAGCSCTLYTDVDVLKWTEQERAKRRKKGWSDAKINRSLDHKLEDLRPGLKDDLIRELASLFRKINSITLAIHWYDGEIDKEHVEFVEENRLSINDLIDDPAIVKTDVIYRIHRG